MNDEPRYIPVNGAYNAIGNLRDERESAWPPDGQPEWLTPSTKVALFVSADLLAGCDFSPHMSRIPFLTMWNFVLEAVRTLNLFTRATLVVKDGTLRLDVDERVKLLVTFSFRVRKRLCASRHRSGTLVDPERDPLVYHHCTWAPASPLLSRLGRL